VQTLSILEEYLEEFNGCVIAVSHDRYFLDRTVQKIFSLEPGGNIRQYPGNYSVYLDYKQAEETTSSQQQAKPEPKKDEIAKAEQSDKNSSRNSKSRQLSSWEKREFEELEGKIAQLEAQKAETEKVLFNAPPGKVTQVQELYQQLETLNHAIETATERWLELAELES
jgi:ABC transport system ATP-binding/permease protein